MNRSGSGRHEPSYLYRISWRRDDWAAGYWRRRYAGNNHARVVVARLRAAGTPHVIVERVPVDRVDWERCTTPGRR